MSNKSSILTGSFASSRLAVSSLVAGSLLLLFSATATARSRHVQKTGTAAAHKAAPGSQSESQGNFDQIVAAANAANDAEKYDEAIVLYRKALAMRPGWTDGWWALGTVLYTHDKYADAIPAFKEVARLQPKAGAGWAMLGLCEFEMARYDAAFSHIEKGRVLGVGDNADLMKVMRFHEGLISILKGEFERAQMTLADLAYQGVKSEDLIIALGLSVLRIPMLPKQVDVNYRDHEVIRRAGVAELFNDMKNISDAAREYQLLARDYPKYPNVQYAYGRFLLGSRDDDGAIAAFQRELQNNPNHSLAMLQIAYIKLEDKDPDAGLALAEKGVKLNPQLPLGHYILGRLYLETGKYDLAIKELETAKQMVPNEAKIFFSLYRAYEKANRKEEAESARQAFMRLSKEAQEAASKGVVSTGVIPEDRSDSGKPPKQ